ncbi:hypothetical protein OKA04_05780 [Luteolibacter flavescens]|uniref:LamG-like jellyroll fold domain-containing protein n=1 Tax=Luteolibacter flavescens TaxID=1859460 RepID=A0ABT3FKY6_9BACT|nr:LamG-like jellyroll fold domain-containing protein [Luteolibacter flavescens]MCW1884232.1 hypothetical protein [Luteolibacter flavescens]
MKSQLILPLAGLAALASPLHAQTYTEAVLSDSPLAYFPLGDEPPEGAWRSTATNLGTLGATANGLHFPGLRHRIAGALASDTNVAAGYTAIDTGSIDGGVPTVIPFLPALNTQTFSVEAWLKPDVTGAGNAQSPLANRKADGGRTGWIVYQRAPEVGWNLRMYTGTGTGASIDFNGGPYTVGQWQHFVATFNGNTATIYINGVFAGSDTLASGEVYMPNSLATNPLGIGGVANGSENPFIGGIDEVALYDFALTAPEVQAHYQAATNPNPTTAYKDLVLADTPVAYYRLDEAAQTTVTNLGTLGTAADAVMANTPAVIDGPQPPKHGGFPADNAASLFNGTSTYVDVLNPTGLNFTGQITLEAWIQPSTQTNFAANIIAHGLNDDVGAALPQEEVFFRIENGNYEVGSLGGKASFAVPAGDLTGTNWIHLAGTWSGGQWRLYRNGVEVATGADSTGAVLVNNANWGIGARGRWKRAQTFPSALVPGDTRLFNGGISDAAIYNTALSADRIKAHFMAGLGPQPLVISRPNGVITLDWGGGTLQQSDDLNNNWQDVLVTPPYQPNDGPRHFYRLKF